MVFLRLDHQWNASMVDDFLAFCREKSVVHSLSICISNRRQAKFGEMKTNVDGPYTRAVSTQCFSLWPSTIHGVGSCLEKHFQTKGTLARPQTNAPGWLIRYRRLCACLVPTDPGWYGPDPNHTLTKGCFALVIT